MTKKSAEFGHGHFSKNRGKRLNTKHKNFNNRNKTRKERAIKGSLEGSFTRDHNLINGRKKAYSRNKGWDYD